MTAKTKATGPDDLRVWLRAHYGRTVALARACGVTRQTVYNWINRRSEPRSGAIETIATVTDGAVPCAAWFAGE